MVMVVDEYWFVGEVRGYIRLKIKFGGVVYVGYFVRGKKLCRVFVVIIMHLERIGVSFGVVVGYLVSFEELHL